MALGGCVFPLLVPLIDVCAVRLWEIKLHRILLCAFQLVLEPFRLPAHPLVSRSLAVGHTWLLGFRGIEWARKVLAVVAHFIALRVVGGEKHD